VEERRRWRRPAGEAPDRDGEGIGKSIGRWIRGERPDGHTGPATRASDHVPNLDFDGAKEHKPAARMRLNKALSKNRVR
jgi:hypothetical protein